MVESQAREEAGRGGALVAFLRGDLTHTGAPPEVLRRARVVHLGTLGLLAVALPGSIVYWAAGFPLMSVVMVATGVVCLGNLVLLRRTLRPRLCAHLALCILYGLLVYGSVVGGGFYDPNFSWFYLLPLAGAVAVDLRACWIWAGVTIATALGFWGVAEMGIELQNAVDPEARALESLWSRLSAIVSLGVVASSFVWSQRRTERELAASNQGLVRQGRYTSLLQDAAMAANEATRIEDAMHAAVRRICATTGWPVGHAYVRCEDGSLAPTDTWKLEDPDRFARFRAALATFSYEPGVGLPGSVLESGSAAWIEDLNDELGSQRAHRAVEAGLRSAVAFPVCAMGQVVGVLEFFTEEPLDAEPALIQVLSHVGVQLGRVGERQRLEDRLRQSQKMEAVGQLAAGLAHEINNPMAYVRSNLHHLLGEWRELVAALKVGDMRGLDPEHMAECEGLIHETLEGVDRTIGIVRDVKEFSGSGGGRRAPDAVDLNEVIEASLRVARAQSGGGITVERGYGELPAIQGSAQQLRQVFLNLIINAIQALGEDGGTLRVATKQAADEVTARVEDDGPGIPSAVRERLFDPFFTTKGVGEGTGLGLYISYEIVRNHGGSIQVESEPGVGTAFEVRLPVGRPPESADEVGPDAREG